MENYQPTLRGLVSALLILLAAAMTASCAKPETGSLEERVDAGVQALRIFNFEEAYRILTEVQPEIEKSNAELWQLATYSRALAAWHDSPPVAGKIAEAKELLEAIVSGYPDSEWAATALLDLGRIAEIVDYRGDVPRLEVARDYYERVRREFTESDMALRATLNLAQTHVQSLEPEGIRRGIDLLKKELETVTNPGWVGVYSQYLAELYAFYLQQPEAATDPYLRAVEAGLPRSADADGSLWQLGLLAEEVGRELIAAENYTEILEEHPRSIYGSVARERLQAIARRNPEAGITMPALPGSLLGRKAGESDE